MIIVVTSRTKTILQLLDGRGEYQEDRGIVHLSSNLLSPLNLDLQQHVGPLGWRREGRPVEIAVKIRPLEEVILHDRLFESRSVDEYVLGTVLARSLGTSRPTSTQPQTIIQRNECTRNRALANATRTDEYGDEWFSGQGLGITQRAALAQVPEPVGSWQWTRSS